jgi:hypothetical protein
MSDNMNRVRAALRVLRKRELEALMTQLRLEMQELAQEDLEQEQTMQAPKPEEQVDVLADVKAAHAAGKTIVFRHRGGGMFTISPKPVWNYDLVYEALDDDEELTRSGIIVKKVKCASDPWAGVKEAFLAGKRIAWRTKGDSGDSWHVTKHPTWMDGFEYKVCDEDLSCEERFYLPDFGEMINLVFTRSGVTGETTVVVRK